MIDLLIGLDYCNLLPDKVEEVGNLQLMKGPLGYCLRGSHPLITSYDRNSASVNVLVHHTTLATNDLQVNDVRLLNDEIKKYFTIESLGILSNRKCEKCSPTADVDNISILEEKELRRIKQGLSYDSVNLVWHVEYPWIRSPTLLPDNYVAALDQLKSLEKRLLKSQKHELKLYSEAVTDMMNRNVVRKLSSKEVEAYDGPVHYVPHHGVLKESSLSTPLRIVFNSSSSFMGHRLNDYWAKGPDVLNSLIGVLMRFRQDCIGINGDISKMFNTIRLKPLEQHIHRFLWRNMEVKRAPDHYVLTSVPFGDKPSGAIVMTAMNETAKMKENDFPAAADAIRFNSYVDDILPSVATVEDAIRLTHEIEEVLRYGGFKIKHWVISGIGKYCNGVKVGDCSEGGVLGMIWLPEEDVLKFKVDLEFASKDVSFATSKRTLKNFPETLTRRSNLSFMSRLFDSLGLLVPFTLRAKLLMREICISGDPNKPNWDTPVNDEIYKKSKDFF